MANTRLTDDLSYRFYFALPGAIADITVPTDDELNANPTNDPSGLIFNLTCALDTGSSQFDLDDPTLDDSTTFCQIAGNGDVLSRSATVVYAIAEAKDRWANGASTAAPGFNTSTLAKSLLAWRGIEGYAIMSVGKGPDEAFAEDDRVKIVEVATDWAIPGLGDGNMATLVQSFAKRTDIAWNVPVVAAP